MIIFLLHGREHTAGNTMTKNFADVIRAKIAKDPHLAAAIMAEQKRMDQLLSLEGQKVKIFWEDKWIVALCISIGDDGIYASFLGMTGIFIPEEQVKPLTDDEKLSDIFLQLSDSIENISRDDRRDLVALLQHVLDPTSGEELVSARRAIQEIIDNPAGTIIPMPFKSTIAAKDIVVGSKIILYKDKFVVSAIEDPDGVGFEAQIKNFDNTDIIDRTFIYWHESFDTF